MPFLQDIIHRLEVGAGQRYLKVIAGVLAVLVFLLLYNARAFRNFSNPEAMDSAQVARNLAEGRGFTTRFVRPFSIHLVKRHQDNKAIAAGALPAASDPARLKSEHPDLANPPVYPVLLAGWMKLMPFKYQLRTTVGATVVTSPEAAEALPELAERVKPPANFWERLWRRTGGRVVKFFRAGFEGFWYVDGRFWRYQPDFLIALLNQLLLLGLGLAVFGLTRRMLDREAAWIAALVVLGTELFWKLAASGLSTTLLMLLFLGLCGGVWKLEQRVRLGEGTERSLFGLAALVGLLLGLGTLTRYAYGWLIIPVIVFLLLFTGSRRGPLALLTVAVFALTLLPWVVRNYHLSGTPFGTAGYAVIESTLAFPENRLERSLNPDLGQVRLTHFARKLLVNGRSILQNDLPKLGGSWVTAFFLVGILVGFRNPGLNRLRYFLLMALGTLVVAQALGRTQLSDETPEVNSENLLVIVAPLVFVYGVSLFLVLLEQIHLPWHKLRYLIMGVFVGIVSLPLLMVFLPPRPFPIAYPPYYPPVIQQTASWLKEEELMMSDIPWAVAWYGNRQAVWLTLNATRDPVNPESGEDFFAINDYLKAINALYLTPATMDSRFLTHWVRPGNLSWGSFILESMVRREIPPNFPLRKAPAGFLPEQLLLTDWERWRRPGAG